MAAMNTAIYLIVTPNPVDFPNGLTNAAGNTFFYIKFGDGNWLNRYGTHNPTFHAVANNSAGSRGTFGVPGQGGASVGLGTFLEKQILQQVPLADVNDREWYVLQPGGGGVAALQPWIVNFFTTFQNKDFDGNGMQTSDEVAFDWAQAQLNDMVNHGFH